MFKKLATLSLCSLLSFGALANDEESNKKNNLKLDPAPVMVGGYSSDKQMFAKFSAIDIEKGILTKDEVTEGNLYLGNSMSFSKFQSKLKTEVSVSGSYGMFSASAGAMYARYVEEKEYSQSFYFIQDVKLPTKIWTPTSYGEDLLTTFGKSVYNSGAVQFRNVCGDQFIHQVSMGAQLFVTFKIDFASRDSREQFKTHISAGFGTFSAKTSIESEIKKYNIKGNMEVVAYQVGGDPTCLSDIFQKDPESGSYYVASFSLDNLSAADGIIGGILDYANTDFTEQVGYKDGEYTGDPASIDYAFADYSDIGIDPAGSILDSDIIAARKELGDYYKKALKDYDYLLFFKNSPIFMHMTSEYKSNVVNAIADYKQDIEDIESVARKFFEKPEEAVEVANMLIASLKVSVNYAHIFLAV